MSSTTASSSRSQSGRRYDHRVGAETSRIPPDTGLWVDRHTPVTFACTMLVHATAEALVKIDKQYRLLLANQLRILEGLCPKDAAHYRHCRIALEEGYELHYPQLFEPFLDPMTSDQCREVQDVLEMYSQMRGALERIGKAKGVKKRDVRFPGFDASSEARELGYTRYLIGDLGRYDELPDKHNQGFESETPMLPTYRRMVAVWRQLDDRVRYKLDHLAMMRLLEARGWSDDGWDADED